MIPLATSRGQHVRSNGPGDRLESNKVGTKHVSGRGHERGGDGDGDAVGVAASVCNHVHRFTLTDPDGYARDSTGEIMDG